MECDWEIEIGSDAPVIDAAWVGYADLRSQPRRATEICETAQLPALAQALIHLNSASSPVWTAKCDVWTVEEVDPDEMDADREQATSALACYIDLVPNEASLSTTLEGLADWCLRLCVDLRTRPLRQSRVDAIVRRAFITADEEGLAVTAYVAACGASPKQASETLSAALAAFTNSVLVIGSVDQQSSKYNQSIVGE